MSFAVCKPAGAGIKVSLFAYPKYSMCESWIEFICKRELLKSSSSSWRHFTQTRSASCMFWGKNTVYLHDLLLFSTPVKNCSHIESKKAKILMSTLGFANPKNHNSAPSTPNLHIELARDLSALRFLWFPYQLEFALLSHDRLQACYCQSLYSCYRDWR